jgi:hypothetical protein
LEYYWVDLAGLTGNIETRTVNVVDTTPPVVTLVGTDVTVEFGSGYTEQ